MQSSSRLLSVAAVLLLAISGCSVVRGEKTAGTALDDTTITARVKTALAGDPDVAASRIDVDVNKGRVTLTGTAHSRAEASRAKDLAQRVDGVKSVDNNIRVAEADSDSRDRG
jgi:hyperosmotically inducible periplasmic protein